MMSCSRSCGHFRLSPGLRLYNTHRKHAQTEQMKQTHHTFSLTLTSLRLLNERDFLRCEKLGVAAPPDSGDAERELNGVLASSGSWVS